MSADLDDRESLLARYGQDFEAGATIFREGEAAEHAFLVQQGRVRLFKRVGASDRSLRVARPGDVFGECALLQNALRGSTAIALDRVRTLAFDVRGLDALLNAAPATGAQIVQPLARRLREAEDQIEILLLRDVQSKVVVALLKLAEHATGGERRPANFEVTPLELSTHVGLDVDSVKRIVFGLREAGYVRIQNERVEVPDLDALRELYGLLGVKDQLHGGKAPVARARVTPR